MSDDASERPSPRARPSAQERRRRRARVFGDVLPDRSRDEGMDDDAHAVAQRSDNREEWLRREKPPHHD
jgi:hypothetical protein